MAKYTHYEQKDSKSVFKFVSERFFFTNKRIRLEKEAIPRALNQEDI